MSSLFLSPHNDDAVLFGSFTLLREQPHVVVVFRSVVQEKRGTGITAATREQEDRDAMIVLGLDTHLPVPSTRWEQWEFGDDDPDVNLGGPIVAKIRETAERFDHVYAPFPYEHDGNPQHDAVGTIAREQVNDEHLTYYHTYTGGRHREESQHRVPILDPDWVRLKLLALACYTSQIREPSTGHHFTQALHEWYA